jgi:hypothetical protein
LTVSLTPSPSATLTATIAASQTLTPSATSTNLAALTLDIVGCNTSLDISHQMGEVTNAYALIRNVSPMDFTNVCATLTASDEARQHPDKTRCVASLPSRHQVTLKLTVDTGFRQDTAIQVEIISNDGISAIALKPSCREVGLPDWVLQASGEPGPIP